MKMLISPTSPYARKARILVAEKKLHCEMQAVNPYQEDADYVTAANPLCKIPVLLTDEGAFFDSRVICEYLDVQGDKPKFLPDDFSARMAVKVREAAADGVLDAGVAIVMAGRVAPDMQNDAWKGWLMDKVKASLASFERKLHRPPAMIGHGRCGTGLRLRFFILSYARFGLAKRPSVLSAWFNRVAMCDSFIHTDPRG